MEKSLNPKNAAEQVHDTFRKTAAQFEELARDTEVQLLEKSFRKTARFVSYAAQSPTNPDTPPCIRPLPYDRRFVGEAWQRWPYNLIYQSFLLTGANGGFLHE